MFLKHRPSQFAVFTLKNHLKITNYHFILAILVTISFVLCPNKTKILQVLSIFFEQPHKSVRRVTYDLLILFSATASLLSCDDAWFESGAGKDELESSNISLVGGNTESESPIDDRLCS